MGQEPWLSADVLAQRTGATAPRKRRRSDMALRGKQKKIAQAAKPKSKITGADFAALRKKRGKRKSA
tara:strand:- start:1571 stop:1771 length:201 start_codon:yes stop_codon:yes gene_type:complete